MTDLPRLKNKILLNAIVLACTVLITQNAYSAPYDLPDGLIADLTVNTAKQSIPSKNLTSSDAEELSLRQQAVSYKFLAGIAEKAIAHSVDVLPVAPKDANGVYYIDIASTHKAVTIPSKVKDRLGDQRVSLDALRYIYAAAISLNKADAIKNTSSKINTLSAKSALLPSYPYSDVIWIKEISSAAVWPNIEALDYGAGQSVTNWDHGGGWVGIRTIELLSNSNHGLTGNYCGTPMQQLDATMLYLNSMYGQIPLGYLRTFMATTNCASGSVVVHDVPDAPSFVATSVSLYVQ